MTLCSRSWATEQLLVPHYGDFQIFDGTLANTLSMGIVISLMQSLSFDVTDEFVHGTTEGVELCAVVPLLAPRRHCVDAL